MEFNRKKQLFFKVESGHLEKRILQIKLEYSDFNLTIKSRDLQKFSFESVGLRRACAVKKAFYFVGLRRAREVNNVFTS